MYLGEKNSLYGLFLKAILLAFLPPHSMLDWSSFSVGLFHKRRRRRKYIVRQDCNWSIFFLSHLFPTQHHSYISLRKQKDVRERWKNYHVKLCFLSNSNAYLTALWQIRTLEFLALPNVIKTIPMHFWETFFENLQSPCYNQAYWRRLSNIASDIFSFQLQDRTNRLSLKDFFSFEYVPIHSEMV